MQEYQSGRVRVNLPKRRALLHKIQQKVYAEARVMPVWELSFRWASGPRVAGSGLTLPLTYSDPYADVRLSG